MAEEIYATWPLADGKHLSRRHKHIQTNTSSR
jgi:hypothetical protein